MAKGPLPRLGKVPVDPKMYSGPEPEPTETRPQTIPDPGPWNDGWNISMDGGGPNIPSDHITSPDPVSLWSWDAEEALTGSYPSLRELDPNARWDPASPPTQSGYWNYDSDGGSTGSTFTGPSRSTNQRRYVWFETSSNQQATSAVNSPIILSRSNNTTIQDFLSTKTNRSIRIVYSAAGTWFSNTQNGLLIRTSSIGGDFNVGSMSNLSRNIGWVHSHLYAADESITDYNNSQFTSKYAGGWREISVNIPDDVRSMALVADVSHRGNGNTYNSDIAITEIELAGL